MAKGYDVKIDAVFLAEGLVPTAWPNDITKLREAIDGEDGGLYAPDSVIPDPGRFRREYVGEFLTDDDPWKAGPVVTAAELNSLDMKQREAIVERYEAKRKDEIRAQYLADYASRAERVVVGVDHASGPDKTAIFVAGRQCGKTNTMREAVENMVENMTQGARRSGKTTRMMQKAVAAVKEGKRVAIVFPDDTTMLRHRADWEPILNEIFIGCGNVGPDHRSYEIAFIDHAVPMTNEMWERWQAAAACIEHGDDMVLASPKDAAPAYRLIPPIGSRWTLSNAAKAGDAWGALANHVLVVEAIDRDGPRVRVRGKTARAFKDTGKRVDWVCPLERWGATMLDEANVGDMRVSGAVVDRFDGRMWKSHITIPAGVIDWVQRRGSEAIVSLGKLSRPITTNEFTAMCNAIGRAIGCHVTNNVDLCQTTIAVLVDAGDAAAHGVFLALHPYMPPAVNIAVAPMGPPAVSSEETKRAIGEEANRIAAADAKPDYSKIETQSVDVPCYGSRERLDVAIGHELDAIGEEHFGRFRAGFRDLEDDATYRGRIQTERAKRDERVRLKGLCPAPQAGQTWRWLSGSITDGGTDTVITIAHGGQTLEIIDVEPSGTANVRLDDGYRTRVLGDSFQSKALEFISGPTEPERKPTEAELAVARELHQPPAGASEEHWRAAIISAFEGPRGSDMTAAKLHENAEYCRANPAAFHQYGYKEPSQRVEIPQPTKRAPRVRVWRP